MKRIVVMGGGEIGRAVAFLLRRTGDYEVLLADRDGDRLTTASWTCAEMATVDVDDVAGLDRALKGAFAVLSALPYTKTIQVAEAAARQGVHYFDLTEDVASTRKVKALAETADVALAPQCGLAPGFIAIAGHDLAHRFDDLRDLELRVGALPRRPVNALGYALTWSTEGLINEYIRPCEAIVDGERTEVPALEDHVRFTLDGVAYEAFNTSGGLGTLWETLDGRVRNLRYQTIRYPGHRDAMRLLLNELKLRERPDLMKEVLENAIPGTLDDVVLVFVNAVGRKDGRLMQRSYANYVHAAEIDGRVLSAIQISTASAACAMIDLMAHGKLPARGFIRQEQVSLDDFLANRFGRVYADRGAFLDA